MERYNKQELARFNSYFVQDGQCKLWQNHLDKDGYGVFYFRKKNRRAHRVSYYFAFGDIAKGMVIDHICRNRNCVEPSHLRLVTARENTMTNSKSVGAVNSMRTHCIKGHPFDRKYGKQRYCSICSAEKTKRLREKWKVEANSIAC